MPDRWFRTLLAMTVAAGTAACSAPAARQATPAPRPSSALPAAGEPSSAGAATAVVPAPFVALHFGLAPPGDLQTVTALVTAERGQVRIVALDCRTRVPTCAPVDTSAPGTLEVLPGGRYALDVTTRQWGRIRLTGAGARLDFGIHNCPQASGETVRVTLGDGDRITWSGTVGRTAYENFACNFYVRDGTGERRVPPGAS